MNDREYRVIGVMPPSFEPLDAERFYDASAELWAPIGYDLSGDSVVPQLPAPARRSAG